MQGWPTCMFPGQSVTPTVACLCPFGVTLPSNTLTPDGTSFVLRVSSPYPPNVRMPVPLSAGLTHAAAPNQQRPQVGIGSLEPKVCPRPPHGSSIQNVVMTWLTCRRYHTSVNPSRQPITKPKVDEHPQFPLEPRRHRAPTLLTPSHPHTLTPSQHTVLLHHASAQSCARALTHRSRPM